MLGYNQYAKSINGIQTLTDGKIFIQNGNINNCTNVNTTNIDTQNIITDTHYCNEMTLTKNNITITTNEFLTLDNINTNFTIESRFNNIDNSYNNLQSQIENNTSNIATIQGNIISINNVNNQQNANITQLQNFRTTDNANIIQLQNFRTTDSANITTLQGNIATINTINNNQTSNIANLQSNVATIQNNYISNLVVGNVSTNTLSAGSNSSVSLTISTPSTNTRNLNFSFSIPRGDQGIQGLTGTSFIWKGQWDNNSGATYYFKNDVAYYGGASWICLGNKDNRDLGTNRDINPRDDPDEWSLMANKGDTGEKGSTGDSGLSDFLSALGLSIAGATALGILASVLEITQTASSLQDGIDGLGNDLDNSNQRIAQLENKTQNQSATVGTTRFKNYLAMENSLTLQDTIILDGNNSKIQAPTIEANDFNSNNNIYASNNVNVANSTNTTNLNVSNDASIGTSAVSSINISGLNVNINGLVYINGYLYTPYIPTNFFTQW